MATPSGVQRWNLMAMAERRGLEVWDVEEYPASYFNEWLAFFEKSDAPPPKPVEE